jgi:hypothetical protein
MPGGGKGSHALTSGGGEEGAFSCPLRGKDVRRTGRGLHLWNSKTLVAESNQQAFFYLNRDSWDERITLMKKRSRIQSPAVYESGKNPDNPIIRRIAVQTIFNRI